MVRVHPTLFPLTIRPSDWSVATPSGPQTERLVEPNTSVAVGPGGRYEARLTFTVKHVYWNGYGTYLTWHPSQLGLMGPVQVPIGPGAFDIANGTP